MPDVRLDQKTLNVLIKRPVDGRIKWGIVGQDDLIGGMMMDFNREVAGFKRKDKRVTDLFFHQTCMIISDCREFTDYVVGYPKNKWLSGTPAAKLAFGPAND